MLNEAFRGARAELEGKEKGKEALVKQFALIFAQAILLNADVKDAELPELVDGKNRIPNSPPLEFKDAFKEAGRLNEDPIKRFALRTAQNLLLLAGIWEEDSLGLREEEKNTDEEILFDNEFTFNSKSGEVVMKTDGRTFSLTPIETRLFTILLENSGKVVTNHRLEGGVWGEVAEDNGEIKKNIHRIRKKFEPERRKWEKSRFILSVNGVGYVMIPSQDRVNNSFP